jgi:hypothetical protein
MSQQRNAADGPMTIYEVHLGSWRRVPEEAGRPLTYREIAPRLAAYLKEMGFSHVELLPLLAHPFYGSWGYQATGYFAPDSRYGTPQDLMFLVETLHREGVGVILDWAPSHFAGDEHGLAEFDTLVRHGVPVIAVVGNDASWSQIAREQVKLLGDDVGTVLARSAYHEVVRGFGGAGLAIERAADVRSVLQRAREIAHGGTPVLVNVWLDRTDFREGSISM